MLYLASYQKRLPKANLYDNMSWPGNVFSYVCSNNALVICNHGPYGAGNSGGIAGLKYQDFTFEVSRQCRGKAGLLIPAKTAGEIAGRFDRGLPVYSTVFYPNFGRVLKRYK